MKKRISLIAIFVFLMFTNVHADSFSVDILSFNYTDDAGRNISYDFTSGQMNEPNRIEIPSSAVISYATGESQTTFLWESTIKNTGKVELLTDPGICRFSVPAWHFNGDPEDDYIGDFMSMGAFNASQTQPLNWSYSAKVANFHSSDQQGAPFKFSYWGIGMESWDSLAEVDINCEWYTGWHEGQYYENVLVIIGEVSDEIEDESWSNEPVVIYDLDPAITQVELKLQVQNGTTCSGYYRINDQSQWQTVFENIEAPYDIPGFPALFPTLEIENGAETSDLVKFEMAELARINHWWLQTCDDYSDNCMGTDINEDGIVDWDDFFIFVQYWLTNL